MEITGREGRALVKRLMVRGMECPSRGCEGRGGCLGGVRGGGQARLVLGWDW